MLNKIGSIILNQNLFRVSKDHVEGFRSVWANFTVYKIQTQENILTSCVEILLRFSLKVLLNQIGSIILNQN